MPVRNFPFKKANPDDVPRPYLPTIVINPHTNKSLGIWALIDTGADECAFPAALAKALGHDLCAGRKRQIMSASGSAKVYAHTLTIRIKDFCTKRVLIDFIPNLRVPLLGVKSFLSNFVLTVDYPHQRFSLKQSGKK